MTCRYIHTVLTIPLKTSINHIRYQNKEHYTAVKPICPHLIISADYSHLQRTESIFFKKPCI